MGLRSGMDMRDLVASDVSGRRQEFYSAAEILPVSPIALRDFRKVLIDHPLVQHKIGLMRNAALSTKDFRELANELGTLLAYEATADLDTEPHTLPGWAGSVTVQRIAGAKITVVPILRAGLGMLSGVLSLIPAPVSAWWACSAMRKPCSRCPTSSA